MLRRLEFPRDERAPATARRAVGDLGSVVDAGPADPLRCEVIDDGDGFVPRVRGTRRIGGWGLDLVEQLAGSWGVREGSTHVWFELPARQRSTT